MRELALLHFSGMTYGIWRDEFEGIDNVSAIHWLPPAPGYIAGMAAIDKRTSSLFDLSACLGFASLSRNRDHYAVVKLEYKKKPVGILVEQVIDGISIPENQIFPLPDYLSTIMVNTCVKMTAGNFKLIPVIQITRLVETILKDDFKPVKPDFRISEKECGQEAEIDRVAVFTSGGKSFALPATSATRIPVTPGLMTKMEFLPSFIAGVTVQAGGIEPVLDLSKCMKLPESRPGNQIFGININGKQFSVLVDADKGSFDIEPQNIKLIPPIAQSEGFTNAVMLSGELIPLINASALLKDSSDIFQGKPLPDQYNPESSFDKDFGRSEIEVIEFELLGIIHAVPEAEVEDTFSFFPFRQLPGTNPIVAGIVNYEGEILPVIDLAVCFGKQSTPTEKWQTLLIKNGDFRALVLVEKVFEKRVLPLSMQHKLPFGDPFTLIYGCFTNESAVRLILNVTAMVLNFEKTIFKKIFKSYVTEKESLSEIMPVVQENMKLSVPEENKPEVILNEPSSNEDAGQQNIDANDLSTSHETIAEETNPLFQIKYLQPADADQKNEPSVDDEQDEKAFYETKENCQDSMHETDPEDLNLTEENLFETLSNVYDLNEADEADNFHAADDQILFDKLNQAFDSTMNKMEDSESEQFNDVIEEILANDDAEDAESLFPALSDSDMEIITDDLEEISEYPDDPDATDEETVDGEDAPFLADEFPELIELPDLDESDENTDTDEDPDLEEIPVADQMDGTDEFQSNDDLDIDEISIIDPIDGTDEIETNEDLDRRGEWHSPVAIEPEKGVLPYAPTTVADETTINTDLPMEPDDPAEPEASPATETLTETPDLDEIPVADQMDGTDEFQSNDDLDIDEISIIDPIDGTDEIETNEDLDRRGEWHSPLPDESHPSLSLQPQEGLLPYAPTKAVGETSINDDMMSIESPDAVEFETETKAPTEPDVTFEILEAKESLEEKEICLDDLSFGADEDVEILNFQDLAAEEADTFKTEGIQAPEEIAEPEIPESYHLNNLPKEKSKTFEYTMAAIFLSLALVVISWQYFFDDFLNFRNQPAREQISSGSSQSSTALPESSNVRASHQIHQMAVSLYQKDEADKKKNAVRDLSENNQTTSDISNLPKPSQNPSEEEQMAPVKSLQTSIEAPVPGSSHEIPENDDSLIYKVKTDKKKRITPAIASKAIDSLEKTPLSRQPAVPDRWFVYSIRKGDNLWNIAKRTTGNGINYHELAAENKIVNPDLIFPEQKLKIKK